MAPDGTKSTWEKYGTLNSFYLEVKRLILRLQQINDKISKNQVSILFNQT